MEAKIIWTTLPNGIKGEKTQVPGVPARIKKKMLQISVFVSPRLMPDSDNSTLEDFVSSGRWPKNWTETIRKLKTLEINISQSQSFVRVEAEILNSLDQDLWDDIFPLSTPVTGYEHKDYSAAKFRSFSVKEMQNSLKEIYREVADIAPNNLPKLIDFKQNPVLKDFLNTGSIPDKFHDIRKECIDKTSRSIENCLNRVEKFSTIDFSTYRPDVVTGNAVIRNEKKLHFALGYRYYNRLEHDENNNRVYTLEDEINKIQNDENFTEDEKREQIYKKNKFALKESFSFERLLTTIGDYPFIMRKLGLIIDLEIPMDALGDLRRNRFTHPEISIEAPGFLDFDVHIKPKTHTVLNVRNTSFYARPEPKKTTYIKETEIDMEKTSTNNKNEFDLIQVDIDGATLKSIHTANSFIKLDQNPVNDAATKVLYGTSDDASLPSMQSAGISLARYNRAYETQLHLKEMYDKNDRFLLQKQTPELYANDLVRGYRVDVQIEGEDRWYSLCQRDGTYKIKDGDTLEYQDEGYVKTATLSTVDENSFYLHENMFRWDGWSLCIERPGKLIYDEEKIEDNIEEAIKPNEIDSSLKDHSPIEVKFTVTKGSLPKLRFGQTYQFRVRIVDIAGNSKPLDSEAKSTLSTTYKRFEPVSPPSLTFLEKPSEGESLEHIVIRSNFNESSAKSNKRHFFPAKTSQLMAETHGEFDKYIHSNIEEGFKIASRDAKDLLDCENCKKIPINPKEGVNTADENIYIVCSDDKTYAVPYLPDVYADGVALRNVPGMTFDTEIKGLEVCKKFNEVILKVPFSGKWPDVKTFRIEIQERIGEIHGDSCEETFLDSSEPKWNDNNRVLTVYLAKGEISKVKYSSYLNEESIENMGMTDWTEGVPNFKNLAVCGMNWMVAPFRELTLVHAVKQPLCAPKIQEFYEDKNRKRLGNTFAKIEGTIETNAKSTDKVEILARWNEVVDNPQSDKPTVQSYNSVVMELPIQYSQNNFVVKDDGEFFGKHEFGDTKFRLVSYHLNATSRFREYFSAEMTKDINNITREGQAYKGMNVRMEKELPEDYGVMIELGKGEKKQVIPIYNSARPHAPKISYVIPTFGWEGPIWSNQNGVIKVTKKRKGKGLRVYLERPWFSSGDGEMLGVVLLSDCFDIKDDMNQLNVLKPYVSQWGKDPVYVSSGLDSFSLRADKFTLAKCFKRELTLEELSVSKHNIGELQPGNIISSLHSDELEYITGNISYRMNKKVNIVDVVGHKVEYDANKKLWFSDIVIDSGEAYNPFVRLGLARYQPNSIDNAHLSRVVLSDFMQLLPDREFEVRLKEVSIKLKKYINIDISFHGVAQNNPYARNIDIVLSKYILDKTTIKENLYIGWIPIMKFNLNEKSNTRIEKPDISEIYKIDINEFEHFKKDSSTPTISETGSISPRLVYSDSIIFNTDEPFNMD